MRDDRLLNRLLLQEKDDKIARLKAEIERLRAEVERLRDEVSELQWLI